MPRSRHKKLLTNEAIEFTISGLSHEGRGIARDPDKQDKITFVFGALPGETVTAKLTRSMSRYNEAMAQEILISSVERVEPPCPHFGVCGGCQLQHLQHDAQITEKQNFLAQQLTHFGKITPKAWLAPLRGDPLGYRNKARLGVRYVHKKEALLVGFREQSSNKLAMIDHCAVLHPRVGEQILALRACINQLQAKESIAQIEVAVGGEEVALVFRHLTPLSPEDVEHLLAFGQTGNFSIYLQSGSRETVKKIWPQDAPESPALLCYHLPDQGLAFQFHPLDFTQVNPVINQKMINQALMLLDLKPTDTVLDLFCGLGNFSLAMAQKAAKVTGIEGSAQMVQLAEHNAAANQLSNVYFQALDLSQPPREMFDVAYDKIVLDPPRCGAKEIVEQLALSGTAEILYVSCNPATFARDAAILVSQNRYYLDKVGVMDMFPHTAHVETMALFRRI